MGMQLLGTGCVLLLTSRWFVLAVPPIALAYNRIHIYFTHASREVQHLAGAAEFRNVAMRYRNSIPPSLKEVSFVIEAGWRVGVTLWTDRSGQKLCPCCTASPSRRHGWQRADRGR